GRLLRRAPWRGAVRRTRRLRPSRTGPIDLRRSALHAIRSSGELMTLFRRKPRVRRRPLVLICDVSGSMERYSRLLMIFAHAIARREDLEAFVFSTRLTRITRLLRHRDLDRALESVSKGVHDFSGGTRIGDALGDFNRRWARRVLGHGAVVLIVRHGCERGGGGPPRRRRGGPRRPAPPRRRARPPAPIIAPVDLAQPAPRIARLRAT